MACKKVLVSKIFETLLPGLCACHNGASPIDTKEKHRYASFDIGICVAERVNNIFMNWSIQKDKRAGVMSNSWPD